MNTDSDINSSETQQRNVMNILTMHSKLTGLDAGITRFGDVYLPSTFEFFSPFADPEYIKNVVVTGAGHRETLSLVVGGQTYENAFNTLTLDSNIPHIVNKASLTFLQPRTQQQNLIEKYDPAWEKYVERQDVLARYPIDFAGPKLAMLRPLMSASTQWRTLAALPYFNAMCYGNSNAPLPEAEHNVTIRSLNSVADMLSQPSSKRLMDITKIRCFDGQILKAVYGWDHNAILPPTVLLPVLHVMFVDFASGTTLTNYTLVDVSAADDYVVQVAPEDNNPVTGEAITRAYRYMSHAHTLEDHLMCLYLYPVSNSCVPYYRNQLTDDDVLPVSINVTKPKYDFMDHYVSLNTRMEYNRWNMIPTNDLLITIKNLAKQVAKYMDGHSLLPNQNYEGYRDIQMDLTLNYNFIGWDLNHMIDFFPFELIYVFGGSMKDFQTFVTFTAQTSGDLPTRRFEQTWASNATGTGASVYNMLPQDGKRNTTLGVKSRFLANAANSMYATVDGGQILSNFGGIRRATRFAPTCFNIETSTVFRAWGNSNAEVSIFWIFGRKPVVFGSRNIVSTYNPLA